ncbi:oxidoreductase [Salinarchaeum laminariae]|uniref:oxidoreductase n=1 Tax=Salinarchaeum laminariae TaxID=869888 RepID=UPI0020BF9589|nr:oxidoreductase [Salinarchaeum laminariae]
MAVPFLGDDGWSLDDVPDQSGRTVVITGANSGLGLHATRAFASKGADVVMACRSVERGEQSKADMQADVPADRLTVERIDLSDLSSVDSFVEAFESDHDALDVLVNNAGIMAIPRQETAEGFEYQFGVNHLGHFALTAGLLNVLESTDGDARIVTQSSGLHTNGEIHFDDLQWEDSYDAWGAYAQSKLANVLFAYELDRRLDAAGSTVTSVACHPGYANTNLQRRGPEMQGSTVRIWAMKVANALVAQSAKRGALPTLYAATDPAIAGGEYVGPGGLAGMRGAPEIQASSDLSYDESLATRLWEVSEELTGVEYEFADG